MSATQAPPNSGVVGPPPGGWTNAYEDMGGDYEWGADGVAVGVAQTLGLAEPTPRFSQMLNTGGLVRLFQSGGKFYLWNPIENDVWLVTQPAALSDIVNAIDKGGLASLTVQKVDGS